MRVRGSVTVNAPRDEVWRVVADSANYAALIPGVSRWEPTGDTADGAGARYLVRLQVGAVPVGSEIEIVEFSPPGDLAWASVTGIDQRGRWRLRDTPDGRTSVTLRLAYQAPGGLLALLADRVAEPMVQRVVDETLLTLCSRVEGHAPRRRAGRLTPAAALRAARVFVRTGILRPTRPDRLLDAADALLRWRTNPAAGTAVSAALFGDEPAIVDDDGTLTFAEVEERTNRLANALRGEGVHPGTTVGVMCRNHRGLVETVVAVCKLGADLVLLNTGFSPPQVADVCDDEGVTVLVHDAEFDEAAAAAGRQSFHPESLHGDSTGLTPPARPGRIVILTSGTTGRPKGAPRSQVDSIGAGVALLSRIPLRVRDTTVLAAPMFHAWGFTNLMLGLAMSSTLVLRRKFDPAELLADVERHRARVVVAVPVMLQRLLQVDTTADTSSLSVVAVSGSALPGPLVQRFMDAYGDVLYNLYGSTEVAWATIADPAQLRAAPGTCGTPAPGTTVRIFDEHAVEQPRGRRGRIFVGNEMTFSGYTGGGTKPVLHGLVDTGDIGRFDTAGRLFVDGRSDDMIVSGGENVFPEEVEALLVGHPAVADAAVVGVDDEEFGQRLAAFVVASGEVSEDEVKRYVRDRLARHKVPRDVRFVDELPRNPTGKVVKRALPA